MKMKLNKKGFTLVETLVGIMILFIGFIPVYLMFLKTEEKSVETVRKIQALGHAKILLNEIKTVPMQILPVCENKTEDIDYINEARGIKELKNYFTEASDFNKNFFKRYVQITEEEGCKRVKVFVLDKNISGTKDGNRGETMLETLIL